MRSILEDLYGFNRKHRNLLPIAILASIFIYYFAENFVMSGGWEVLTLRSIDDYAIQDSVHSMQKKILSGDWKHVFGFFDYAYGNAFWLFNSILLLPLYFIGDAQALIVAGRQISLIFVFSSIYIVGLIIDRLRPDAGSFKYSILIALAAMPMVAIISTKLHVNAQSLFFGILSFYLLIRPTEINKQSILFSALFGGISIGFKLTGIFIAPLLCIIVLDRLLKRGGIKNAAIGATSYLAITMLVAATCTAPALLLFPFFIDELKLTYKTFLLFRNMASTEVQLSMGLLIDSLRFYLDPFSLAAIFISFALLIFDGVKNRRYISLYIFLSIVTSLLLVFLTVHKGAIFVATYFLNLAFFMPLGLLGICTIKHASNSVKIALVYCLVIVGLFNGVEYRLNLLAPYDFFGLAKSEAVKRQMAALAEMRRLVYPLKLPVRILQDSTSIFPATRFTDGVDVAINYGDLKEKSTLGDFDYIALNSRTYYGKKLNYVDPSATQSNEGQMIYDFEEMTRKNLRETGKFYGRRYKLIYSGYDTLLYKLEDKK